MKKYILFIVIFCIILITGCNRSAYRMSKKGRIHKSQIVPIFHPREKPKSWKWGAAEYDVNKLK